ncbi:MAG: hypothetical protein IPG74_18995 [Flavobacteriales bacterium]|nr:hypothetical protein [Flavobacteriales bacterium]
MVVLEDIVDTGGTVEDIMASLAEHHPASVSIAALLFKPERIQTDHSDRARGLAEHRTPSWSAADSIATVWAATCAVSARITDELMSKLNIVLFGPPGAGKERRSTFLIGRY